MIEYRVKPVTRYIVTRYNNLGHSSVSTVKAEVSREEDAYEIAAALCITERDNRDEGESEDQFLWPGKTVSPIGVG